MIGRQRYSEPGFVLELDGRAVFAFSARTMKKARALCTRDWLSSELMPFRSLGLPLWHDDVQFIVRPANPHENATLQIARTREIAEHEFDGYTFVFLVPLDPTLQ
jgi:hypothetical protein